ncbi:MAG: 2-hydroxyacid dehydrogenase, partial [bacterium]
KLILASTGCKRIMKVLRLAWSGYQDKHSLKEEQETIERLGLDYFRPSHPGNIPNNLSDFQIIIINSQFSVDENFISSLAQPSLIITASSGYDHIDLPACKENKITVARTPLARAQRVAAHTEMFMRALLRNLPASCFSLREGRWKRKKTARRVRTPEDEKAGIIGFGVIGRKIVQRFMDVFPPPLLVADPLKKKQIEDNPRLQYCSLHQIIQQATVLTLHASLNNSTHELINRSTLQQMPPSTLLINTARGKMINLPDLSRALENNEIAGAALDVFPQEPPSKPTLLKNNKLLTTPHAAGFGPGLLNDLRSELISTINSYRNDEKLPYEIKPFNSRQLQKLTLQREELEQ